MTTLLLVRHGAHDRLGRYLDGRREGVHLSDAGRRQAERLATSLAGRVAPGKVFGVHASPLDRARETAAPIAAALTVPVTVEPALNEIDFGDWSGQTFEALNPLDAWQRWNSARSIGRTPAGDTMRASQGRILDLIDRCRSAEPEGTFVLVSHADPIKAALVYVLGLSLDDLGRFEIAPASLSRVEVDPWGARVTLLNEVLPE